MLPNYLVIGAPRSGTSWLARNLRTHPQVYLSPEKEIHFFDRHYTKSIAWYEKLFKDLQEIAVGEATPEYLYGEKVPGLIHQVLPDVKLIASLRDPTERAYSHYCYRHRDNKKAISFEQQLNKNQLLIEKSLYAENLQRYYDLFPKSNILILRYEDIKTSPDVYMSSIFGFLGVDDSFVPPFLAKVVNSSASRSRSRIIHKISNKLSKLRFDRASNIIDKISHRDIPPISKKTRKELIEKYFLNDINKLEKLIDQDLSQWKQ